MVKIEGSVRFALLTVRQKNGTVTVAIAVKNGTVKKTENGTDTVRYGTDTVRYGTDTVRTRYGHGTVRYGTDTVRYGTETVTNSDALLYLAWFVCFKNMCVKLLY